jgi:hypothetical protein
MGLKTTYETSNKFAEGEIVVVKRGDGASCFGRIETVSQGPGGPEYMICVDESNGKFLKESSRQIGKLSSVAIDTSVHMDGHGHCVEAVYEPPSRMKGAHVSTMDEYFRLYRQSLDEPEAFWSEISNRFHWETKWHTLNKVNFDTTKGPVSIEW